MYRVWPNVSVFAANQQTKDKVIPLWDWMLFAQSRDTIPRSIYFSLFHLKLSFQPANPTFPLKYMYVMENSMWVYFICLLRNKWIGVLINCYLATSWDFCVSLELNQQSSFESSNSLQIEPLNYFKKVAIINWTKNVIRFPYKQHLIHVCTCMFGGNYCMSYLHFFEMAAGVRFIP